MRHVQAVQASAARCAARTPATAEGELNVGGGLTIWMVIRGAPMADFFAYALDRERDESVGEEIGHWRTSYHHPNGETTSDIQFAFGRCWCPRCAARRACLDCLNVSHWQARGRGLDWRIARPGVAADATTSLFHRASARRAVRQLGVR